MVNSLEPISEILGWRCLINKETLLFILERNSAARINFQMPFLWPIVFTWSALNDTSCTPNPFINPPNLICIQGKPFFFSPDQTWLLSALSRARVPGRGHRGDPDIVDPRRPPSGVPSSQAGGAVAPSVPQHWKSCWAHISWTYKHFSNFFETYHKSSDFLKTEPRWDLFSPSALVHVVYINNHWSGYICFIKEKAFFSVVGHFTHFYGFLTYPLPPDFPSVLLNKVCLVFQLRHFRHPRDYLPQEFSAFGKVQGLFLSLFWWKGRTNEAFDLA